MYIIIRTCTTDCCYSLQEKTRHCSAAVLQVRRQDEPEERQGADGVRPRPRARTRESRQTIVRQSRPKCIEQTHQAQVIAQRYILKDVRCAKYDYITQPKNHYFYI